MTTIQKTITIPDDHRVNIELSLPESIPAGVADVVVTISPKRKCHPKTSLASLAGSLADGKNLDGVALPWFGSGATNGKIKPAARERIL